MKKVGTHDGTFHADEVFALATLKIVFSDLEIFRTRKKEVLADMDFRVDVGGCSDGQTEFDHHQKGGAGERENGIPYASFGLIWNKFGYDLCQKNKKVFDLVEKRLVQGIDGRDNGLFAHSDVMDLSQVISVMNLTWQEDKIESGQAFTSALSLATTVVNSMIKQIQAEVAAEQTVMQAIEQSKEKDSRLLVLTEFVPWRETVCRESFEALFVVYPSKDGERFKIETVPEAADSFENRQDLPVAWGGLEDEELQKVTGVSEARFCHRNLFLVVANNQEAIMKLAELALK